MNFPHKEAVCMINGSRGGTGKADMPKNSPSTLFWRFYALS